MSGEQRVTYALKILGVVILGAIILRAMIEFMLRVQTVAIILIGAVFLAYLLTPLVRLLMRWMRMGWAIAVAYVLFLAFLAGFAALVVPPLAQNLQQFVVEFPSLVVQVKATFTDPHTPLLGHLAPQTRDFIANFSSQMFTYAERYGTSIATKALTIVLSTVGVVAIVVAIPVVAAYFMIEAEGLKRRTLTFLPLSWRPEAQAILRDLDRVIGGFIRGQLIVATIIGGAIAIMLTLTNVKYGLLIGVAAGVLDLIPYVGAVASFIPAVLIAGFSDGLNHAILVAALFILIFELEGHFISPKIVSESVGLTPLMVIIAVLVGADLFGIAGMFVAVPVAGMLRVIAIHAVPEKQQRT